jgi:hypothetical protein
MVGYQKLVHFLFIFFLKVKIHGKRDIQYSCKVYKSLKECLYLLSSTLVQRSINIFMGQKSFRTKIFPCIFHIKPLIF